jgi:hypothetical protein
LREFVRKPSGREEGIGHDDDVFGVALAVEGLPYAAKAFAYRDEEERERRQGSYRAPVKYGRRGVVTDDDD